MAACGDFFMGQFALFTYVYPLLETVTHVNAGHLTHAVWRGGPAHLLFASVH